MQGNSMTWTPLPVTEWMLIGLCCLSSVYITVAALMRHGSRPWGMTRPGSHGMRPATISVLKPLCGLEPRLYANLETFCRQTHPSFQLLFGVSSATDPAVGVVNRLREAYPDLDITLVVNDAVHGVNLKVSNLINLAQHARHEVIVDCGQRHRGPAGLPAHRVCPARFRSDRRGHLSLSRAASG